MDPVRAVFRTTCHVGLSRSFSEIPVDNATPDVDNGVNVFQGFVVVLPRQNRNNQSARRFGGYGTDD
jgi:hypothetical protein